MAEEICLVLPYHFGPALTNFSTPLLYFNRLGVSIPGWGVSVAPIEALYDIVDAAPPNHYLAHLLKIVFHYFRLAQDRGKASLAVLEPLEKHLIKTELLYPGTREHFTSQRRIFLKCVTEILASLESPSVASVAATDFMWRVYEYKLSGMSPQEILSRLEAEARLLGDPLILLAECLFTRLLIAAKDNATVVDNNPYILAALDIIDNETKIKTGQNKNTEAAAPSDHLAHNIGFIIFNRLIAHKAPKITSRHAQFLASLLEERSDELRSFRLKCRTEARQLIQESNGFEPTRAHLIDAIDTMKDEVQAILDIDKHAFSELASNLATNKPFWLTVAGLLGAQTGNIPAPPGALFLGACVVIGCESMKQLNQRRKTISASPWRFIKRLEDIT